MKRILGLLLALALLTGCAQNGKSTEVTFFYRCSTDGSYFSDLGVMDVEERVLHGEDSLEGMMELYLRGPISPELVSPFPEGMALVRTEWDYHAVTLTFSDTLAELSDIDLRVAAGCIARTVWAFHDDDLTVNIRAETRPLDGQDHLTLRPEELVFSDRSAGQEDSLVNLYFCDAQDRYLIEEQRSIGVEDPAQLPEYILRSLLEGPLSKRLLPTIPEDTMLLGVSVSDGVCTVTFSDEFADNRFGDVQRERLTIFSIVNSLCQLDEIDSVEIVAGGRNLVNYGFINLSERLSWDGAMVGPVRSDRGEFDADVFVCMEGTEKLLRYPMRLEESADQTRPEAVMDALMEFEARNGYYSMLSGNVSVRSVEQDKDCVTVNFSPGLLENCGSEAERTRLLRSIVATLSELEGVEKVLVSSGGEAVELDDNTAVPKREWFAE